MDLVRKQFDFGEFRLRKRVIAEVEARPSVRSCAEVVVNAVREAVQLIKKLSHEVKLFFRAEMTATVLF